jgi:hypothetical protein
MTDNVCEDWFVMAIRVVEGGVRCSVVEGGLPQWALCPDEVLIEIRIADGWDGSSGPERVGREVVAKGPCSVPAEVRAALGKHGCVGLCGRGGEGCVEAALWSA